MGQPSTWRSAAIPIFLVLALTGRRAWAQGGPAAPEREVKAAYLLNFTRYVEWPPSAFQQPDSPITICVVGADPFGSVLDQTVDHRRVQGRTVRVQRIKAADTKSECHVVFLASAGRDLSRALKVWRGRPVLLVGNGSGFVARGGTIAFVLADETVRFEINAEAARASGLQISSRVMALATRVHDATREP